MALGTIVSVVRQGSSVTGAVRVDEGPGRGPVEYVATVPAVDARGVGLSSAEVKAALLAAWQAQRAAQLTPGTDASALISGNVNL